MKTLCITAMIGFSMLWSSQVAGQVIVDIEDQPLAAESFYNGADLAGGFTSNGVHFSNLFDPTWQSWSGFAFSNQTDTTTPGFGNQYSSIAGSGAANSSHYGVAFVSAFDDPATISLPQSMRVESIAITNTTYAGLSMQLGDQFAKKFGGPSGNDPDFLRLDIHGMDSNGDSVGTVEFYLADFRSNNSNDDHIVDQWTTVDLSSLGSDVASLQFEMETTDVGDFGANTPSYFAFDNLTISVPEPAQGKLALAILGTVALISRRRLVERTIRKVR